MINSKCSQCDASFVCNIANARECWCHQLPAFLEVNKADSCLCPECLALRISARIETFIASSSLQALLSTAAQYKDNEKPIEHIDYTIENDYMVFSQWYHLKRGSCCGNGCQHCPYT